MYVVEVRVSLFIFSLWWFAIAGMFFFLFVIVFSFSVDWSKVVSSNSAHGEVYSIQHYVIKFVSDLRQVGGFLRPPISSTNKTDLHDITEILLKVASNTITPTSFTIGFHLRIWLMNILHIYIQRLIHLVLFYLTAYQLQTFTDLCGHFC